MAKKQATSKTYKFKAETKQLLDILAHSLYTNREIFIRELVSNAADALDKVRFEEVRGTKIADPDIPFEIRIDLDKDKKLFTITDTGIGMTDDELVSNLGTIAHSGSADFLKRIAESDQEGPELIGQFGVGFYSVFMAGKEVVITTRSYNPEVKACQWRSDGTGRYTISPVDKAPRGTKIEVHLRDDATEFAEKFRIENVITKYSNFIPFPNFITLNFSPLVVHTSKDNNSFICETDFIKNIFKNILGYGKSYISASIFRLNINRYFP